MALNELGLGFVFQATDLASGVMDRVSNKLQTVSGKGSEATKAMKEHFGQFALGMGLLGGGLVGLSALGSTVNDAREFGKAIDLVRTEVDEATFSNQAMRDITIDMGKEFGRLPKEEAEAMYKAVALGANTAEKSTALMTAANQLAVAGNSELKTTMDALGGSVNAYGLGADDAGKVSDFFFTAMKNGNTTVQDLASSVGRVSAGAHAMGIGIDEVLGSVAVMTNKGVQASEAVSYLHGALANIVHPSKDAEAEAKRLGIQFDTAAIRSKGWAGFLHSITDNSKLTSTSLEKLFTSVEGSQAMAMLAGDIGAVDNVMREMSNSSGATKKGFDIMAAGLDHQSNVFKANISALRIRVGEFLEGGAARFLGFLNRILNAFTNLPGPVQGTIVSFLTAAASTMALVGGLLAAKAAIGLLSAGLGAAGVTVGGILAALWPVVLVLGLAVAAVAAFRIAMDQNLGGVATFVQEAGQKISLAWRALTELFSTGGFSKGLFTELDQAGNQGIKGFVIQVYLAVNRILNFLDGLKQGFTDTITANAPVFEALKEAVMGLVSAFGLFENDAQASGQAFANAGRSGSKVGEIIGKVAVLIVAGITAVVNIVRGLVEMWDLVAGGAREVGSAFGEVFSVLGDLITELTGAGTQGLTAADVFRGLGMVIANILGAALSLVAGAIRIVGDLFSSVGTQIGGVVDLIAGILSGDWDRAWNGAKRVVLGMVGGIFDAIMIIPRAIAVVVDSLAKLAGTSTPNFLGNKLRGFQSEMKASLSDSLGVQSGGAFIGMSSAQVPSMSAAASASSNAEAGAAAYQQAMMLAQAVREGMRGGAGGKTEVRIPLMLDGAQLTEALASYDTSQADREGAPQVPGG